jgi:transposase-like protein
MRSLARRHGINPKTVAKWKKRECTEDRRTGLTVPRSTVLTVEQEAIVVAFRKHTLLPLDDCLYALQSTIPRLTRSSLHRCLERHGISRLPEVAGEQPRKKKFDIYPIGFFHIDLAEVRTAEGKLYLFVAIDRTSKFAVVELVERADMRAVAAFLEVLVEAVPYASTPYSPTTASSLPICRRTGRGQPRVSAAIPSTGSVSFRGSNTD